MTITKQKVARLVSSAVACGSMIAFASASVAAETAYDRVVAKLRAANTAHAESTSLVSIGKNDQGQDLYALKIGAAANQPTSDATSFLVVGAHHGNETYSVDVALRFIDDQIARSESTDDGVVYHVIPVLNVSGYNISRREESRASGGTQDPNRDYPDPCRDDNPYRLQSTKAIAEYVQSQNVAAAVTIHGYIGTFTYPWGTYTTVPKTLDDTTFKNLGRLAVAANGYDTGTHGELIYPTVGAFEDWAYYDLGVWVTLLEIENRPNVANDAEAMHRFFANAPRVRSLQHEHTGRCTTIRGPILGRP
jgi:hypothetical protein